MNDTNMEDCHANGKVGGSVFVVEDKIISKDHHKNGQLTNGAITTNGTLIHDSLANGNITNSEETANGTISNGSALKGKTFCGEVPGSEIQEFYKGKSIFITGATGFVGKVLLERLLVSCPGVDTIYILVRGKKDHSPSSRLEKLLQCALFNHIDAKTLAKIYPVVGDMGQSKLGVSNEDYQMLCDKVHVVIHCAANVRFDAPLSDLIRVNVKGTCDLLDLSRKTKNLMSFVYVSTIYSNYRKGEIVDEKIYEPGLDLDVALYLENVKPDDEETLHTINGKILQSWPNLYSFTKSIAENAIKIKGQGLPVCIFRPGLVSGTAFDHPVPGYLDNTNGTTGVVVAMAMGVVRVIPCNRYKSATLLPADYCANAIIACAWDGANKIHPDPKVFNYIPHSRIAWSVAQLIENALKHAWKEPFDQLYSYPQAIMIYNLTIFRIMAIFVYFVPGFIMDNVRTLMGKEPMFLKNYRRLVKHCVLGYIFASQVFDFKLINSNSLFRSMCSEDQNIFKMNLHDYDILRNYPVFMRGVKQYLLKENAEASEDALRKLRNYKRNFYLVLYSIYALGFYLLYLLFRKLAF